MPPRKKRQKKPPKDPNAPSPQYGRTYPREVYTDDEMLTLLAQTAGRSSIAIRNAALIATGWQSGLRVKELLALETNDFDLDARRIFVRHGKNDKARRVVVGDRAVDTTRRWLERRARLGIPIDDTPLFCTLKGGELKDAYVRQMLNRLARSAGWSKRIHPHGLRHTYAANLAKQGMRPDVIQRMLGHDNLSTTSIYLSGISTADIEKEMEGVKWA